MIRAGRQWLEVAADWWQLGAEASMVVPLRLACIASGGAKGKAEARRMFDEKVDAHQDLVSKLGAGGFGTDVPKMASGVLRHYLVRVRANRKRLVSELIG